MGGLPCIKSPRSADQNEPLSLSLAQLYLSLCTENAAAAVALLAVLAKKCPLVENATENEFYEC